MKNTRLEIESQTRTRVFVRLFPAVTSVIAAVSIGATLYFSPYFQSILPPSPIAVSGSTQTAVWEVGTPTNYAFNSSKISVTSNRAELNIMSNWWDTSFQYRTPLVVTTGANDVAAGKTVALHTGLSYYTTRGYLQNDYDDIRVVYWDGVNNVELQRDLIPSIEFVPEVRFKLQAPIAANSSSQAYYLYFGNPSVAAPSVDLAQVYEYFEGFSVQRLSGPPADWVVEASGNCANAFQVNNGVLTRNQLSSTVCSAWNPNWVLDTTRDWQTESTVAFTSPPSEFRGGIYLRGSGSPSTGGYWLMLMDGASDVVRMVSIPSMSSQDAATTLTPNQPYRLSWKYDYQNSLSRFQTVWLNGLILEGLQYEDTNPNLSSNIGYPGIVAVDGAALVPASWDDFKVWENVATVGLPSPFSIEGQYYGDYPSVETASGQGLRYGTLNDFSAVASDVDNDVRFLLSPDNGSTWWSPKLPAGSGWQVTDGSVTQARSATTIGSELRRSPFPINGTLRWRAFLGTAGGGSMTQAWLDQVALGFTPDQTDLDIDGSANPQAGGYDCYDSLMSMYSTQPPNCDPTAAPAYVDASTPLTDHAWVQDAAGTMHLFYQDNAPLASLVHATSADLKSFTPLPTPPATPWSKKFDFNETSDNNAGADWESVVWSDALYDEARGWGFTGTSMYGVSVRTRTIESDLVARDFFRRSDSSQVNERTFKVRVPADDDYVVTIWRGDPQYGGDNQSSTFRRDMIVRENGGFQGTVPHPSYTQNPDGTYPVAKATFSIPASDGSLDLTFTMEGICTPYYDCNWGINALEIEAVATNESGGTALVPTPGAWDRGGLWSPHIVQKDNVFYLFYTGVTGPKDSSAASQRIGLATSTDLVNWTKYPVNNCAGTSGDGCVYDCRAAWTDFGNNNPFSDQCRDPMVIFDPAEGQWKMFADARLTQGGATTSNGVSVATSPDLVNWTSAGYLKATRVLTAGEGGTGAQRYGGEAEAPVITQHRGTYYLFFSDVKDNELAGPPAETDAITQYATANTLSVDAGGSTNWTYRGPLPDAGVNAVEVAVLNNDTWLMSQSVLNANAGSPGHLQDLRLKRVVWGTGTSLTFSNLTNLSCRVGSDTINPDAPEVCGDGIDNNCSGVADEPAVCAATACTDADNDGYGATASSACTYPEADCDDSRSNINPAATEVCDQRDNDCDGQTDEGGVCTDTPACAPQWSCGPWSVCQDQRQSRTCTDDNACGTDLNKPELTRSCGTPSCTPRWSCGVWSVCKDQQQARTCTDENTCGLDTDKPVVSRACVPGQACTEDWSCGDWSACSGGYKTRSCRDKNACETTQQKPKEREECTVGGPPSAPREQLVVVAPNRGKPPQVRLFDPKGKKLGQFTAYGRGFSRSGVNLAVGDVDGDGASDILTGTQVGSKPFVRLFTQRGKALHQFSPYGQLGRVGVSVGVGDVDGDGTKEMLIAPGKSTAPIVRMYRFDPKRPWFAHTSSVRVLPRSYKGGVSLAAADLDGDNQEELIVSTTGRAAPRVFIYDYNLLKKRFVLKRSFLAFARGHRLGVRVAAGDIDGDGLQEIIASSGPGGRAHLRVFDSRGHLKGQFFAAPAGYTGGANPAALDVNGDGQDEILTVSASRGASNVFIFSRSPDNRFKRQGSFPAFPVNYRTGLQISTP